MVMLMDEVRTTNHKSDIPFDSDEEHVPVDIDLAERERAREEARRSDLFRAAEGSPSATAKRVITVGVPSLGSTNVGLRDLQKECWTIADNHGFHDVGQTFGDKLMLLVTEAAEAMEAFREGHALDEVWYEKDGTKPCGIPSELADIFIRLVDTAEDAGIDLATVVLEKMEYNRTRPFLHGKKL